MSKRAEMFKFTQLRPVNGIDYYVVQSKHFPLYDESKPTPLLKKIQQEGLPLGIKHALLHIGSVSFKDKLDDFENQSVSKSTEDIDADTFTLISILQKIIDHIQEYPLTEGKHDDLEILQYSRGIAKMYGLDEGTMKEITTSIKTDALSDDLYSLLLVSSYHTEYRRYLDTLYRFSFLVNTYTLEHIFSIFFNEDNSVGDEDYRILRRFLYGRVLLPDVQTNKKPLPKFNDNSDDSSESNQAEATRDLKAVKGISLSVIHQSVNKDKPTKIVKNKRKIIKKLKIKPSKISVKKETKK